MEKWLVCGRGVCWCVSVKLRRHVICLTLRANNFGVQKILTDLKKIKLKHIDEKSHPIM